MKLLQNSKGFSLTEVMIVVAISSIIMGGMFVTMQANDVQMQTSDVKMTIQDAAREGLYRMLQEIRQSAPDQIAISVDNTAIVFNIPNNVIDDMTEDDYSVDWANGYNIQYARGGTDNEQIIRTLTLSDGTVTTTVVANDVQGLTFTGNGADPTLVTVSMSVQRDILNGRSIPATPLQITGQAEIRNS